ncbi:MAG TPA: hypothetical protein VF406_08425 [Thermodesulfobacteriota bacterium]
MRRLWAAVLAAAVLLGGPAGASDEEGANEQATGATRGTAGDLGRTLRRANERATEATRGTAREVGKAVKEAADDVGEAFRDLGRKLSE